MTQTTTPTDRPFIIEHRRLDATPTSFTPDARLIVTAALRTSGLLATLSDEQARTLLALLTFVSPNGVVQTTAAELAEALQIHEADARLRLHALQPIRWNEQPVVLRILRDAGVPVFSLGCGVMSQEELSENQPELPAVTAAGREVVIAHSRETYSTPRTEAEAMVAAQLGHSPEESADTPEGRARRWLLAVGVTREDVEELVAGYPIEEILQQLEWLPQRGARMPARFVVAAIREHYEPPIGVQLSAGDQVQRSIEVGEDVPLAVPSLTEGGLDA